MILVTLHASHRAREANTITETGTQRLDITAGATHDCAPLRAITDTEQSMPVHEGQHETHGEVIHVIEGRRPDGRGHRDEIKLGEQLAQFMAAHIVAQIDLGIYAIILHIRYR